MDALKPLEASKEHQRIGYKHDCPKCHCALGFKEKEPGSILPRWARKTILYEMCQQYCGFCGQKLDWSHVH